MTFEQTIDAYGGDGCAIINGASKGELKELAKAADLVLDALLAAQHTLDLDNTADTPLTKMIAEAITAARREGWYDEELEEDV